MAANRLQHAGDDHHPKRGLGAMSTEAPPSGSSSSSTPGPGPGGPAPLGPAAAGGSLTPGPGGGPGPVAALLPSFSAACGLVSAPYSCLVLDVHRRHLALSPMFLRRKRSGIQQELDTELLRYSESLHGVPLAYDDIRMVGQHGDIYDDSGYIHLDIQANFVIFQPEQGQRLLGTVNKLGATFVGCLVHGSFNASIPKPGLVSVDVWRDAGPRIGSELEFEVSQLDADTAGVLLIRGRLDRTRVQEMLALGESSEALTEPPGQDSTDQTPKKKKKKKKNESTEEDADADNKNNNNKKKKKKKEKRGETEEELSPTEVEHSPTEVELSPTEVEHSPTEVHHHSDSSGYLSDKPSKKRKAQEEDVGTPATAVNGDPQTPKAKKKRKRDMLQQAA